MTSENLPTRLITNFSFLGPFLGDRGGDPYNWAAEAEFYVFYRTYRKPALATYVFYRTYRRNA